MRNWDVWPGTPITRIQFIQHPWLHPNFCDPLRSCSSNGNWQRLTCEFSMPTSPRLTAHTLLIDIDETITHTRDAVFPGRVLDRLVSESHGIDVAAARDHIRSVCDPEAEDVEPHLAALGVMSEEYDRALIDAAHQCVEPYADAVTMIRQCHRQGLSLYPATTNGRCVCLAKLAVAGLADASGSRYFVELFGGEQVAPSGKSGPAFFDALLQRIDAHPEDVVMVGDNPQADLAFAREAGIQQVVLPRREQSDVWVMEPDGGLYVQSLAIVPQLLGPPPMSSGIS